MVVVNYIGDVVKQLMATVDGQQGVPPGAQAQPAALPAPPPPPDRGHVLHAAPGGATEPDSFAGAGSTNEAAAEPDQDRRRGRGPGVASSSGDSRERSVRRTSKTARGRSDRSRPQAKRAAPARNTGWSPMDSVFPPDGDSDTGRGFDNSDYTAQVRRPPLVAHHACSSQLRLCQMGRRLSDCDASRKRMNQECVSQVRAYVAREKARRAQPVRQSQQHHRASPSPERREATSITDAVRDSLKAAMFRADNASEASDTNSSASDMDTDSSSSSAWEDASAGPDETFAGDASAPGTEAGGAHGPAAPPTVQAPAPPPQQAAHAEAPAPPPADAPAAPPNGEAAAPVARAGDEDDLMDVPFEELIGLRGPWRQLFENAATVLASTFVFLLAMLWVPFMLGSFTMAAVTRAGAPFAYLLPLAPVPFAVCSHAHRSAPNHVL